MPPRIIRNVKKEIIVRSRIISALIGFLAWTGGATAETFPTRPIKLIVPFAAGAQSDIIGRTIAARMSEVLGQPVIIENISGGGGQIAGKRVADAPPDGYVIGLGTVGTHAQAQTLYIHPMYNSQTDFTPVALIAEIPIVLSARKDLPVKDFRDFVAYTKANQAKMTYGTAGAGSAPHLACLLLNHVLGINVTHVPYRGTGPATQDLLAGRIDFMCGGITTTKPLVDNGSLMGLAVFGAARSPVMPGLATATEQGTKVEAYT
jgi:tripartite-type tricarboxylate transporter receptor subunit TctC